MSVDEAKIFLKRIEDKDIKVCSHCGGCHARACPRVKRMIFVGDDIKEIEFFQDEQYDASMIVWPDEIQEVILDAEENSTDARKTG